MKTKTLFVIVLVVFSVVLIAGCTENKTVTTPAPAAAVTTGPANVVQNQGGVAIITNQTVVKPNQTAAVVVNQTVAVQVNQTVAVVANQTAAVPVNKT